MEVWRSHQGDDAVLVSHTAMSASVDELGAGVGGLACQLSEAFFRRFWAGLRFIVPLPRLGSCEPLNTA